MNEALLPEGAQVIVDEQRWLYWEYKNYVALLRAVLEFRDEIPVPEFNAAYSFYAVRVEAAHELISVNDLCLRAYQYPAAEA